MGVFPTKPALRLCQEEVNPQKKAKENVLLKDLQPITDGKKEKER
jgi:hypothetical protein